MKQASDEFTADLFAKPRPGRPRKPNAKSGAQRQKEYRQRQKVLRAVSVTSNKKTLMSMSISSVPELSRAFALFRQFGSLSDSWVLSLTCGGVELARRVFPDNPTSYVDAHNEGCVWVGLMSVITSELPF